MNKRIFISATGLAIAATFAQPNFSQAATLYNHNPDVIEELRMRDGLPNLFNKLKNNQPATIVYLGGSITHAEGWRPKTFKWLESQYPKSTLTHVDAAVPGTGADFAACRIDRDVLAYQPDLVFIEYRVNMGGGVEARAIDGLVQRIWAANPKTDICFVYTIGKWMLKGMEKGEQYSFGKIMEKTANYYGIPSIDFAPEVIQRKLAGTLTFQGKTAEPGKLLFSKDGVHPIDAGYEIYKDVIARSFNKMKPIGQTGPHTLLAPLQAQRLTDATFIPITTAQLKGDWQPVDAAMDTMYLNDSFRSGKMLDNAIKTNQEGASFTVNWTGTRLTLTQIPQGEHMEVMATTDGGKPFLIDTEKKKGIYFARFSSLPELPQGQHTTTVTLSKNPEKNEFYAGQCLLLRDPK